ncbi:MAG TPA: hypothetical protein VGR71_11890 [Nitrospira sp.]|nr:hypothetical protein [Nitrospira sp.]
MTSAVLLPERRGQTVDLGNGRFRKQILPIGTIRYRGRKITFDRTYLEELVSSFRKQACGPVPFQLADSQNTHTNDPERRRGTVVDLELGPDGLYGVVELDEDGQELVRKYPDLGVSARIYENYERSDGNFFKAALQHVLGTLDPHVNGMRPWQAVAFSNDISGSVVDLSDSEFDDGEEERKPVATKDSLKEILAKLRESGDEAELTDEELDQLLAITDAMAESGDKEDGKPGGGGGSKKADKVDDELTDEELDALIAAAEADADGETDDTTEGEGGDQVQNVTAVTSPELIAASQQHQQRIDLANAQIEQQRIELTAVKARLAAQQFESEQRTLAQQYGIPPRITELARPLLEGDDGHVIQLANGDEVDAGAVMRKVLTELGQTFKALDLSELIGRGEDEPTDDEAQSRQKAAEETKAWVEQIKGSYSF